MSRLEFSVTYDYRCPFARNAHEHLVVALGAGADWNVDFVPFSLSQTHVDEGGTGVWDDPAKAPDLMAVEVSLVVRDRFPGQFPALHIGLFTARHDQGLDLRDESVVRRVLVDAGVDDDEVFRVVAEGGPRDTFRKAHEDAVTNHQVFGVPTFIIDGNAAFVRVMTRPGTDAESARATIDGVLALFSQHPELNEFKYTSIDR